MSRRQQEMVLAANDRSGPFALGDGAETRRHCHQRTPGIAASFDDGIVSVEHPVAQEVLLDVLPDVSTGFSSGEYGGKRSRPTLSGTTSRPPSWCQPAPSSSTTANAPGATARLIAARCRFIASVFASGSTRPRQHRARGIQRRRCRPSRGVGRARRADGCPARPRYRSVSPADQHAPHPPTRARPACHERAAGSCRQQGGKVFLCASWPIVRLRMARAH